MTSGAAGESSATRLRLNVRDAPGRPYGITTSESHNTLRTVRQLIGQLRESADAAYNFGYTSMATVDFAARAIGNAYT